MPGHRALRRAFSVLVASIAIASARSAALAGPPYQTDDPEPTPYRHYEIYLNSQYSNDQDGASGLAPSLEVNYGLMRNVQLSITGSLAWNRRAGSPLTYGFDGTEIALKMRFVQENSGAPQIAFYPAIVLPGGSGTAPASEDHTRFFLPLWAQKSFGRWTAFGGGGIWRNPGAGNRDYGFTGVALQRDVSETFSVGAELF